MVGAFGFMPGRGLEFRVVLPLWPLERTGQTPSDIARCVIICWPVVTTCPTPISAPCGSSKSLAGSDTGHGGTGVVLPWSWQEQDVLLTERRL